MIKGRFDYIVIGCGIAGANVVQELERRGRSYLVYDDEQLASSHIAAGLINPITGRNYAKSWRFDALLPLIKRNYPWFEEKLSQKFLIDLDIRRALNNASEENKWASRLSDESYDPYIDSGLPEKPDFRGFSQEDRVIKIKSGYRVPLGTLVSSLKQQLIEEGKLIKERFQFELVDWNHKTYADMSFDKIICCEGALQVGSPFSYLPIIYNLGEAFLISLNGETLPYAYKKKVFVVPLKEYYWVGGTYTNVDSIEAAKPDYDRLEKGLKQALVIDYKVEHKMFGIRPTVPDRKPLIGSHREIKDLYVLNGLGTKGTSLAPYAAHALVNHIEDDIDIDEEMNTIRF